MLAKHERTVRSLATAAQVAVATVLVAALPANAAPVPYKLEMRTGFGKLDGIVEVESNAIAWDMKLEDTNKEDGACVYAKLVVDRKPPPENVFRSKNVCFGEPVLRFASKDPHKNKGFTLDFCSIKRGTPPECVRLPAGAGPIGVGPQGVGPIGVGPQGVGPQGAGPQSASPAGVGPADAKP
ncbi:MAG: hypothetical protein ACRDYX_02755 [Egibacteraceae bacterium]